MKTKMEIVKMVEEYEAEAKKATYEPVYYKRHGEMVRRSYDKKVDTERFNELFKELHYSKEVKIFKCECCGKMVGYFELERWVCDFDEDHYICGHCYEEGMGEDL